jgi:hypothetical protein
MSPESSETDVKEFYRLLHHRYLTEIRALRRGHFPVLKIVRDESAFITFCRLWNGRRNLYAGLRDRRQGLRSYGRAEDIVGVQIVTLDVDPVRETETPATDIEVRRAVDVSRAIADAFEAEGYLRPWRAMTGNGVSLYFCLPWLEVDDSNREKTTRLIELFESRMRDKFRTRLDAAGCRIDSMFDLPRIAKIIGTLSLKGDETPGRPWRLSAWIERPAERRVDHKLQQTIFGAETEASSPGLRPVWLMQPIPYFGENLRGAWIVEPKIDGWRMQVIKTERDRVEFWGRRLERKPDWTDKLKAVEAKLLSSLPPGTLLDTELYSSGGRRFIPSLFASSSSVRPVVFVFDIIFWKGKFVGEKPLSERKALLRQLKLPPPFYSTEYAFLRDLNKQLQALIDGGHEGAILKRWNSPYVLGEDAPLATADWRKVKPGR